jgi:peptidoglycan/LPS O-acetylase OafA/YrhL
VSSLTRDRLALGEGFTPHERTSSTRPVMSVECRQATSAPQSGDHPATWAWCRSTGWLARKAALIGFRKYTGLRGNDAVIRMKTIDERWNEVKGHSSGFDYLRLGLALSVLVWHSYSASYGFGGTQHAFQRMGFIVAMILPAFFALSGLLVASSMLRIQNLKIFLGLRVLRIFPALCVEVILSAFILGPTLTTAPLPAYFTDRSFFSYMLNLIGWPHYLLFGVFASNPWSAVNASLWTIPFELECYILISVLAVIGLFKRPNLAPLYFALCTAAIWFYNFLDGFPDFTQLLRVDGRVLVLCFLAGVLIFLCKSRIPYSGWFAALSFVISLLLIAHSGSSYFAPFFVAYFVAYIGLQNFRRTALVDTGDYSYGIYLYAWPMQQTAIILLGIYNNWASNVVTALIMCVSLAMFSWHFVEKPVLRLKRMLKSKAAVVAN